MKKYMALFQGDEVLVTIEAKNAEEARDIFNKQIQFKVMKSFPDQIEEDKPC